MANCSGTTPISPTSGCFSNCTPTVSQTNCGCTPCTAPTIINQGDVTNQVLVPVLADVIQNCICISKYETAFPTNLLITTNIPRVPATGTAAPSGNISITNISYSYSCVGVPGEAGTSATTIGAAPTITANIGCNTATLSAVAPSCSCLNTDGTARTALYNDFTGTATTPSCCCNQAAQAYAQNKIVERLVPFSVCNLSVNVSGTIGGQPFTGTLAGIYTPPAGGTGAGTLTVLPNPTPLGSAVAGAPSLGFPANFNFAGIMCLPTSTRLTINESFDNCLVVDCIRPVVASYSTATDPAVGLTPAIDNASFLVSADLSLIISKNIYATSSQRLAVITNSGAQVVCSDNTTVPACPQTPCTSSTPCPGPNPSTIA
ncbi:hypothetical protein [uncultured Clostridium sp.]|uniref:hypothetical protein n=1 Tax=uncultured Clostridium sp. TaxID=59620 RepID=UPI0025D94DB0|nr:hypothetical protein [uncultured Clostridium sp.]